MNSILLHTADFAAFHVSSAREYMAFWEDAKARKKAGMSLDECSACLCEHVGLVHRYTAKQGPQNALCVFPSAVRKALAQHTCAWIARSALPARARHLTRPDALTAEQIEQAQDLLIRRDALEVALRTARTVTGELGATDNQLLHAFAHARCVLGDVDDAFRARPDIAAVASRVMVPMLAQAQVQPERQHFWWFYEAREWDAEDERIQNDPELLARALGMSAQVFASKTIAEELSAKVPIPFRFPLAKATGTPQQDEEFALAAHTAMSPTRRLESHHYTIENERGGFTISECETEKYLALESDDAAKSILEGARLIAVHTGERIARIKNGCARFVKPDQLTFALQLKNGKHVAVSMTKPPKARSRKAR